MDPKPASRTVMGLSGIRAMGGVRKVPGVWGLFTILESSKLFLLYILRASTLPCERNHQRWRRHDASGTVPFIFLWLVEEDLSKRLSKPSPQFLFYFIQNSSFRDEEHPMKVEFFGGVG
jgi:hypothetical protein